MILNEALTAVYYGYVGLQFLAIIYYNEATQGMNCMKIIGVALGLNAVFGLMSGFYNVYQFIKRHIKSKTVPLKNYFASQKVLETNESSSSPNPLKIVSKEKIVSLNQIF